MKPQSFRLTFITPCFCAGANPSIAEVRAPSVRGKLRWWFRVLGGSFQEECEVFGSIEKDSPTASALIVRVTDYKSRDQWTPSNHQANSNSSYLYFFASKSQDGARWRAKGALSPGSSFELHLSWRRPIRPSVRSLFELALESFLLLGSLGLRSTRGLGCFETQERPFTEPAFESLKREIQTRMPEFLFGWSRFQGAQDQLEDALGGQLRGLRDGWSAGTPHRSNPTPLGSSSPRQASAVHLRPIRVSNGAYRILVFEAPATRVLGKESRARGPRLHDEVPPPKDAPGRRPHLGYRHS